MSYLTPTICTPSNQVAFPSTSQLLSNRCRQKYRGELFETKKTNWALSFSHQHPQIGLQYEALDADGKGPRLSQMNNDATPKLVLCAAIEVKVSGDNEMEARAQLFTWFQAGFSRLRQLLKKIYPEGDLRPTLPLIGWIVIGRRWDFYIAFGHGNNEDDDIIILGPLEQCQCQLLSDFGVFKLLRLIERVKDWARETYWPWYCDRVIEPLKLIYGRPLPAEKEMAEAEDREEREA